MLEPITTGSSVYEKTGTTTPVLVSDIRCGPKPDSHSGQAMSKVKLTEVEHQGPKPRYELCPDSRREILNSLVREEGYVEERATELQQSEGSSAWACTHCTYINVFAKKRCGACRKARPVA